MNLSDKDKFEMDKRSGEHLNFPSSNLPSDWRLAGTNFITPFPSESSVPVSSFCSSLSLVDSYCPGIWDPSGQNLVFKDNSIQARTSTSNKVATRRFCPTSSRSGMDKASEVRWNPANSMSKGVLLQPEAGFLPQSLSQISTDSGSIERAARFSCFSGGNFSDMVNPFTVSESLSSYPKSGEIQPPEALHSSSIKTVNGDRTEENDLHMNEVPKDASISTDRGGLTEGSPMKNERESRSLQGPSDEGKHGVGMSNNESDEAEFSGGNQEEPSYLENPTGGPLNKGIGVKKRKGSGREAESEQFKGDLRSFAEATKENINSKDKGEHNPCSTTPKPSGKHGKDRSLVSDAPKEDYIHVRARRGQATNSHSLAERVRREKISERMKILQDLVPGCSKVTGKAAMLDEIINYVQSLQRQVEIQPPEDLHSSSIKTVNGDRTEQNDLHMNEIPKDASIPTDHGGLTEGSPMKNERESRSLQGPSDEGKHGVGMSNNESDEAEFSGGNQEEPSNLEDPTGEPLNKGIGVKERKRSGQDAELEQFKGDLRSFAEAAKENINSKDKGEQNPSSTTPKPSSKHGKDLSQVSDAPNEDYIHVIAGRGQATNSQSLAERVRREKISEGMKFLQDLVPGCSKVTGTAVMFDEIINYVQSLQRQVEFLSMKLAAVHPRTDFNIEGLLSKDILQSRSTSSTNGFPLDIAMPRPQLRPSQQGLLSAGVPIGNPPDALRLNINSQMAGANGYRGHTAQAFLHLLAHLVLFCVLVLIMNL